MSNWGPFNGASNWVNDTDFGFNFNTKNKIDNQASGKAEGKFDGQADAYAKGQADAYAKGYVDAKNKYYFNETDKDFVAVAYNH
jgi:hypothetical protein